MNKERIQKLIARLENILEEKQKNYRNGKVKS